MSCGFWMRRKRIAAQKRAEAAKAAEQATQVEESVEQTETKPRKKAGAKNGKSDTDTDTKS